MRIAWVAAVACGLIAASAGPAAAGDDADGLFAGELLPRPPIEWSTWIRGEAGVAAAHAPARFLARGVVPEVTRRDATLAGAGAVGADASLALSLHGDARLGVWAELRGLEPFAGGELVLTRVPRRLDLFLYEGDGILAVRAGRSTSQVTASVGYGYVAPWKLEGPCRVRFFGIETGVCEPRPARTTRYMVGVRLVATVTRAIDDPRSWAATLGLEVEPLGALRAMLGLTSWY